VRVWWSWKKNKIPDPERSSCAQSRIFNHSTFSFMHTDITHESIQDLVQVFYGRVREDEILSPVFNKALGNDWALHEAKLVEFWSTIVLDSRSFKGNVYGTHMALTDIEPAHFTRWLGLFEQTTHELFDEQCAEQFLKMAYRVASSLQIGFFGNVVVSR
jgi:hemoglobin